jgi:hypothetical protein
VERKALQATIASRLAAALKIKDSPRGALLPTIYSGTPNSLGKSFRLVTL